MSVATISPARQAAIDLVKCLEKFPTCVLIPEDLRGPETRQRFLKALDAAAEPVNDIPGAGDELALGCAQDLYSLLWGLLDLGVLCEHHAGARVEIRGKMAAFKAAVGEAV